MEESSRFYDRPILNSPYELPARHWQLDGENRPTHQIRDRRREASFISPIPPPRKGKATQISMVYDRTAGGIQTQNQQYDLTPLINSVRILIEEWRRLPESRWRVTPETSRLLKHWRHHRFSQYRPFFCQVEAVETVIWLTEVAPRLGNKASQFLKHLQDVNEQANPELERLALKLATGAGKTTVMAMLIAWQTINAVHHPNSRKFTRGFLVVTPGITIRERLRVLQPNDPDSYYRSRELVPVDQLRCLERAKIVIVNYHAFKLRNRFEVSPGGRRLLQGQGPELQTQETEGRMLQRVLPELMSMRNIMVINDEAHHCYREKPGEGGEDKLRGEDLNEARKNREAARLWISGLETVGRKLGLTRVIDLSATPFFLRGSGYAEGTLFPWTLSDFSLMDAIECGIVKLPRLPVADNIPEAEIPKFRNLWEHIGKKMPKKKTRGTLDPLSIPLELQTALDALYGHYKETFRLWQEADIDVPPCFIVVCNNTDTSKLLYDYISGFHRTDEEGERRLENGRLPLFRNFDENGNALPRPRTLLIDSERLDSGAALDKKFRTAAADEIERFRREVVQRTGNRRQAEKLSDEDLLREAMNTVGRAGRLGGATRCVVSVSMLTEGWDASTVTHVLGVRAFGTQLLCEQVVGRALRRQSYQLNAEGLLDAEYADIFGIPFDFTGKPGVVRPQPPNPTKLVHAVSPERDASEIRFPRVAGYRRELPEDGLSASFDESSALLLTPEDVGPTETLNEGIIGAGQVMTADLRKDTRNATVAYHLTKHLLENQLRKAGEAPRLHLFGQAKRIVQEWLETRLTCKGGTFPAQLLYKQLADKASQRISRAIQPKPGAASSIVAVLNPYAPTGSTAEVSFATSKQKLWKTDARKCHLNLVVCDSAWEMEFCRVLEAHPRVRAYVKNQGLGFDVPYRSGSEARTYIPDFIVLVEDRYGEEPLRLVVEIKGLRRPNDNDKKATMERLWVPGVNALKEHGRWAFAEFDDVHDMQEEFNDLVKRFLPGAEVEAAGFLAGLGGSAPDMPYVPRRRSEAAE